MEPLAKRGPREVASHAEEHTWHETARKAAAKLEEDKAKAKAKIKAAGSAQAPEEEARKERAKRLKAAGIKISDEDILSDDDKSKKEGEMSEIVEIPCYLSRLSISTPSPLRLR